MKYMRCELRSEPFPTLIQAGRVDILVRLANTFYNWSSVTDKEIASYYPFFRADDLNTVKPEIGSTTTVTHWINNPLCLIRKPVEFTNLYCVEKDKTGRLRFDEKIFYDYFKELDSKQHQHIFYIHCEDGYLFNKQLIMNELNEILTSNKVWISL